MSDKKTIIKNFQSMKPSIALKQLDYSKLPKEVRDKMKGDLSGVSDDTLDLQFEQSTFKKWVETFADLYPAAFGIKDEAKVVSIAPVAKVEPVVKAEPIVVAEEKTFDTSELETKIKDLETRLGVVNKMILKQPLKKAELKIRVKTIEKMIAKFKEELKNKKSTSKKKVVKKSLGGFLLGAAGGFIAGQMIDLQLTRKKVRFDLGGTIHGDKKYNYSITYRTIFQSENEESPYEDGNGFEVENEIEELQDILQEAVNKYGIYAPTGSPIHAGISFESVTPKQDRDYFEKGIETYFTLHVKNVDGSDISLEETQLIADKLKEGRKLHWDEEEKNWWKDGGEIHSKDTDGTLIFKADTKGGKYSIEVREASNIHGTYYDIREYTNGSARGVSSISNKELLKYKLIDTIIGSKKIDGINYIISHDDLGVKEYLPASEKIWDIYNSKEIRDWWVALPQETKDELTKYSKEKAINYVKDNNYRYDDSTIGSFVNIFRREKMVKDFYESKGQVMLKDGGEVIKKVYSYKNFKQDGINVFKYLRKEDGDNPHEYTLDVTLSKVKKDKDILIPILKLKYPELLILEGYDADLNEKFNVELFAYKIFSIFGQPTDKEKEIIKEKLSVNYRRTYDGYKKLKNGGDVQAKNWLSDMNQERLNELKSKRAEIEETMPEDFVETSGGSGRTKAEILADFDKAIAERENKKFASGGYVSSDKKKIDFENKYGSATIEIVGEFKNIKDIQRVKDLPKDLTFSIDDAEKLALISENRYIQITFDSTNLRNAAVIVHSSPSIVALGKLTNLNFVKGFDATEELRISPNRLYENGGDFEKALENLHSKASSSTTPRGKNKLKIPDTKYVAVHESKDGYWTIASKPTTKENAEGMLGGTPRGELGKVVTLEEALNHKKVIGEEYLKMKDGGKIGKLSTTYSNPLEYLKAMGAKVDSDLNYSTEKNGINYYIGFKGNKALVVAFIEDEDNYMIDKEDAREMSLSAKIKGIEIVELYTNYGIELHSKEKTKDIGFDKIFKVSVGFKDGGSISSDNTPKVYIADLAAYNEGKLVGEWLDLSEFGSGEEVMEKISELLKQWSEEAGEEREEYSVHDMENFPKQMYSEGMGESSFQKVIDYWEAINGTDYPMEVVEEFASLTGEDVVDAANKMKDAYYGKFDDVEDFAREYVDSVGGIEGVSNPEQYIDISETDKRIIASEEADNRVDDMSDDDILKQADLKGIYDNFIERADELGEDEELDDDDRIRTLESEFGYSDSDEILEEAKESVREEISSEWEKGLRDPYNFLVEEQGIYDASSIMKANFIMFDYKRFGKDLEQYYYVIEHDGEVYVFSQNYRKGGSLSSTRTLGVSKEKVEIEIPEFRPEKLKEQTKTNKKQKTKTMAKKSAGSNKNKERMTLIQSEAKKIWAEGKLKKYSEAVSLASKKLKKEGKL